MGRKPLGGSDFEELKDFWEGRKQRLATAKQTAEQYFASAKAQEKQATLAAIRQAKERGLSDYAIRRATGITVHNKLQELIAEAVGAEWAERANGYVDAFPITVKGWKMSRKKQEGKIGVEGKPYRVVEVVSPDGEEWEANVCQWGFTHGWNYWIAPNGRKVGSDTYHTEKMPWQVRVIAFGEKWLDEVEEAERG